MNFFHIPSFNDHYTLKIWLKNWNLKVKKELFFLIKELDKLLNEKISLKIKEKINEDKSLYDTIIFDNNSFSNINFQIYIKDELDNNSEIDFELYNQYQFFFYLIEYDKNLTTKESILEQLNEIKKVSYIFYKYLL